MPKLFCVMLGGRAQGCNIELHDVVFVVGDTLEATYRQLAKKWFGLPDRIHIDAFAELKYLDGHELILSTEKPKQTNKQSLYFLNFGGYQPGQFCELHQIGFFVASSKTEALARGKQNLCLGLSEQHCDDNIEVDDIFTIDQVDRYYISLQATEIPAKLEVNAAYKKFLQCL